MVEAYLVLLLMIDAAVVFIGQVFRWRYVFFLIALYWAILTVKNAVEWWRRRREKRERYRP